MSKKNKGFEVTDTMYLEGNARGHPYRAVREVFGKKIEICEDHRFAVVCENGEVYSSKDPIKLVGGQWTCTIVLKHDCRPSALGTVKYEGDWKKSRIHLTYDDGRKI